MYHAFEHRMEVAAPPEQVFPLLCPVRERDWIDGWDAEIVRSESGVAERGCVFRTRTDHGALTWIVHRYRPPRRIGFTLLAPDRFVELLDIEVDGSGGGSALRWHRDVTALGTAGEPVIAQRLAGWPESHRWLARALDHYLATGERLPR